MGTLEILEELDLDMGFWGNDPAQVRDLLEPELIGIRVLPGDPLFEGKNDQIIEKATFATVFEVAGQIVPKFSKKSSQIVPGGVYRIRISRRCKP